MTAMNSAQIYSAIEQIAAASGKNDKVDLLKKYLTESGDFVRVIGFALDPFITFGVRPKRHTGFAGNFTFDHDTFGLLEKLRLRILTGNDAALAIEEQYNRLDAGSAELLWRIINKDLKAGFSEESVNKASKGFFRTFPYQRCSLPKDTKLGEWDWEKGIISQIKADGMFFNGDVEETSVSMRSRQGQPLPEEPYRDVVNDLRKIYGEHAVQTHGELLVLDADGNICPREIGNGHLNRVNKGGALPDGFRIIAQLWDMIPLKDVQPKGKSAQPYAQRLRLLNQKIQFNKLTSVSLIETRIVKSLEEAYQHYADALMRKLEGTVIKKPTALWKDGTSKDQIKLKLEAECELEVIGFEEGKEGAKTAKTFGSLQLATSCRTLVVNCSGFTDALREEINDDRESWMGAIVTVRSNSVMLSDDLEKKPHSLFLPRFIDRRTDRTDADDFDRVQWQFENAIKVIVETGA
ncbi:MAG: hypothetical protein RR740_00295 [Pseudomonas sp.]